MVKKIFVLPALIALAVLISCNSSENKTSTTEEEKYLKEKGTSAKGEDLVSTAIKPDNTETEEVDFEGIGKIQSFKGGDWEKSGNKNYNKALDMTIITQSQPGDYTGQMSDFVDGYIEANKRDAPKYEVIDKKEGEIKGVKSFKLDGKFDNGTAYVTRDYLFFTKDKAAVLMCRVSKANESKLNAYVDYIASSYQK